MKRAYAGLFYIEHDEILFGNYMDLRIQPLGLFEVKLFIKQINSLRHSQLS